MVQPVDRIAAVSGKLNGHVDRTRRYFLADLGNFPAEDGCRYEIIEGELIVTPAPGRPHAVVATRMSDLIRTSLVHHPHWSFVTQPINLEQETDDTTFHCEPDMSVFDQPEKAVVADESIFPVIVIEIVSPGNPDYDYVRKVGAYAALGISEYWIVDPGNHAVTVLALAETTHGPAYQQVETSFALPNIELNPDDLFAGLP